MSSENPSIQMTDVYHFLAQAMEYPEAHWLNNDFLSLLDTFFVELEAEDVQLDILSWLNKSNGYLEDLKVEHTHLFINSPSGVVAPPYASVYLESNPSLYGRSAEKVKQTYRQNGFALNLPSDIPDSICCELEFLAALKQEGRSEQEEEFLASHFRTWFPAFRDKVVSEAKLPFYPAIVSLIDFFTQEEK